MSSSYWLETLGCPKNRVDSDKLEGRLRAQGLIPAPGPDAADLMVVNTCAFIDAARQESIEAVLDLSAMKRPGAKLVVTGCMAERYGNELAAEIPEVDVVAGYGRELLPGHDGRSGTVPVKLAPRRSGAKTVGVRDFDLLNLQRPAPSQPWAYLKVAEGCNRACGFCAIPSFRGKQQSRPLEAIVEEAAGMGVSELVLVAQDLASYGVDLYGAKRLTELMKNLSAYSDWIRLLYLYPSELDSSLVEAILGTGIPYFDLSLQHSSRKLLRKMKRWGSRDKFLEKIAYIRSLEPGAVFRSSFIIGYPGETEADQDDLLSFIEEAQLDWAGFFTFSDEEGTFAYGLDGKVDHSLALERLAEASELQEAITTSKRVDLIGSRVQALIDSSGIGRTYREAPEIDGIIKIDGEIPSGRYADLVISGAEGPDLIARLAGWEA